MKARTALITLLLFAACQPVEMDNEYQKTLVEAGQGTGVVDSLYTLEVVASKRAATKGLSLDGSTLNAYWVEGEKVGVYVGGVRRGQLTATPMTDNTKATLSGTLPNHPAINQGDVILLLFPDREDIAEGTKWVYTGQAGAAPAAPGGGDLAAKYDYATASLTVSSVVGNTVTTSGQADFQNEQSIYRFDFKVGGALMTVKEFTVASSLNQLVRSRSYAAGWTSDFGSLTVILASAAASPYLSLRNENTMQDDTYSFMVVGGDDALYAGNKAVSSGKLGNGKFLAPSVTLTQPDFSPASGTTETAL